MSDSEEEIGSAQQQLKIDSQQFNELHREENLTCIQDTLVEKYEIKSDFDKLI